MYSYNSASMPEPRFGSKKQLGSLGLHCTQWVNKQQRPAEFKPWLMPDLPISLIPTVISLWVIDLVSSPVW